MDAGTLPGFDRLRSEGHYQTLATANPPQSPVAWSSFATGGGAGQHGIFDFLARDPLTYRPEFAISRYEPPRFHLPLGGWRLPLGSGKVVNRRRGEPFWVAAERTGHRATVTRVPVTYPPDPVHRMLAGMGVPDLLGTQGTYTLYTTQATSAESGGRVVRVQMTEDGEIETRLSGPSHPLKPNAPALDLPLRIAVSTDSAVIELDGETRDLRVGEWSDWWPVRFRFGLGSIAGMVRMYLSTGYPRPSLYVSPIQADPYDPVVALSSPRGFAPELAERIGRYHTLGMPEETWSLNQGHLDEQAFLEMVGTTLAEGEAMLMDALERRDSELIVKVFVQPDRVSHMFWRGLDETHPLHGDSSELARGAVEWIYREADRIVQAVLQRMGPDDRLVILSDHGFVPFRRAVHLNRWLVEHGYMVLQPGAAASPPLFTGVDWSRTRAYAMGLNGLYLNLHGREGQGIVTESEAEPLLERLAAELTELRDGETPAISRVFPGREAYSGAESGQAPDLVIGYAPGYRASWQTSLGGVPEAILEDNTQYWSGDHCIDPEHVPGVLFTSFEPRVGVENIAGMAHFLLAHLKAPED